jgi:hypothetical protein
MYFRKKTSGFRAYLQIVESRREGAACAPGGVEALQASGQLERLLRSGTRFWLLQANGRESTMASLLTQMASSSLE